MGATGLPGAVDTIVVGGGSAGAVVAARLAAGSAERVLLLEAGPDYGPLSGGRWPAELLDPTLMPVTSHGWGYVSAAKTGTPNLPLDRARVIGGCSSHNGCAAVWGHRADYDGWAEAGNPGWSAADLLPLFQTVNEQMRVHTPSRAEITPWHRHCLDAAPAAGLPVVHEINDLDLTHGIAIGPMNIWQRQRWNGAFAYLDPVRERPNLTIAGETLVDRVIVEGGRAVGLEVIGPTGPARVTADRIVLAAGAYGSPLILLRSGIGAAAEARAIGIAPVHDLPGVGRNLQDHPAFGVRYAGTPELIRQMDEFVAAGGLPREEGTIALASSARCPGVFDLHLYPVGSRPWGGEGWRFTISTALMTPRSVGTVRLAGPDPTAAPLIDHAYLTDPEEYDLDALLDGIALARELGAQPPLAGVIGPESDPLPIEREALRRRVRATSVHDYHPVGTCKMGPAGDPTAVVDARGKVHGLEGLFVADCAIMPKVPRANTNLPAFVVGEKIATGLLGR